MSKQAAVLPALRALRVHVAHLLSTTKLQHCILIARLTLISLKRSPEMNTSVAGYMPCTWPLSRALTSCLSAAPHARSPVQDHTHSLTAGNTLPGDTQSTCMARLSSGALRAHACL